MARWLPNIRFPIKINDITPDLSQTWGSPECTARCVLACAYRLTHYLGWDDSIYGHITARVPGKDEHFLINAFGMHYSEITASSLIKVDLDGKVIDQGTSSFPFQQTGYVIHSAIHEVRTDLSCLMHIHTREGIGISTAVKQILPIFQAYALLDPVSYHDYRGVVAEEGDKKALAQDFLAPSQTLIMRNHGLMTGGRTVEESFNIMYFLTQLCQSYVDSGYTQNPVPPEKLISNEVIAKSLSGIRVSRKNTPAGVNDFEALVRQLEYAGMDTGYPHSEASKRLLDKNMCN